MNIRLYTALLLLMLPLAASAQQENVISYYAVGNSMDGQPQIGDANVLRFYPVFAMREYIDTVRVTIYYGPHVYSRMADSYDDGRYWQVLLPKFELGEAIQRVEVETSMDLKEHPLLTEYNKVIDELKKAFAEFKKRLEADPRPFENLIAEKVASTLDTFNTGIREDIRAALDDDMKAYVVSTGHTAPPDDIEGLICRLQAICRCAESKDACVDANMRETFRKLIARLEAFTGKARKEGDAETKKMKEEGEFFAGLRKKADDAAKLAIERTTQGLPQFKQQLQASVPSMITAAVKDAASNSIGDFDSLLIVFTRLRDSLRNVIASESYDRLIDTMYAGPGVRKSDVIFDEGTLKRARILYRNYKLTLRTMPALDPAERMGIFRARYVPFIVLGKDYTTPFTGGNAVFEIGLGFSNVSVASDDFIIPDFSLKRLGVAFAISSALFGDKAETRALALTYDFNSYGSLGLGANFPGNSTNRAKAGTKVESYISFGINKLAFEKVLTGLAGLFNQ